MKYGQYVGRVGALAVALGISAAIGQGCAVAAADDTGSAGSHQQGKAGPGRHSVAKSQSGERQQRASRPSRTAEAAPTAALAKHAVQSVFFAFTGKPSAPISAPAPDSLLLAGAERSRRQLSSAGALPAASTTTALTLSDAYPKLNYRVFPVPPQPGGPILYATFNFSDGTQLSETIGYPEQSSTVSMWNPATKAFYDAPIANLDMYLLHIDNSDVILGAHLMTPGSTITVQPPNGTTINYIGILTTRGTGIPVFQGLPDIPPIDPNGGPGPSGPGTALTPPTIATRNVTSHSVDLVPDPKGTDDDRVVGYNIYRDGVKVNDHLVSTVLVFRDEDLDFDVTYSYTARSVDAFGNESVDSRPVIVTTFTPEEEEALKNEAVNPGWESSWERINTLVGWIPVVGELLSVGSTFVDLAQLASAIALGNSQDIRDELQDLAGDAVGYIPFGRLLSPEAARLVGVLLGAAVSEA
jgi:hypothetical protein